MPLRTTSATALGCSLSRKATAESIEAGGASLAWKAAVVRARATDRLGATPGAGELFAAAPTCRSRCSISPVRRDDLRALQAPLKERYVTAPDVALVTLSAAGDLGDGLSCSVRTGQAIAKAGLHPATGGDGSLLCSGDMLLEALVACAGVTLQAVATSLGISVTSGRVRAEGDLDFRGTLGVDREAPVGFSAIRRWVSPRSASRSNLMPTRTRSSSPSCANSPSAISVVYQTLACPPALTTTLTSG